MSSARCIEQFGLDVKQVGALDPQGEPAVLDGSLGDGDTLLAWPDAAAPRTVIAINHHTTRQAQAPPPDDRGGVIVGWSTERRRTGRSVDRPPITGVGRVPGPARARRTRGVLVGPVGVTCAFTRGSCRHGRVSDEA